MDKNVTLGSIIMKWAFMSLEEDTLHPSSEDYGSGLPKETLEETNRIKEEWDGICESMPTLNHEGKGALPIRQIIAYNAFEQKAESLSECVTKHTSAMWEKAKGTKLPRTKEEVDQFVEESKNTLASWLSRHKYVILGVVSAATIVAVVAPILISTIKILLGVGLTIGIGYLACILFL